MKSDGKVRVLVCLLVLLVAAGMILGVRYKERADLRAQYQELCEQYTVVLKREVPAKMESLQYYKRTATANGTDTVVTMSQFTSVMTLTGSDWMINMSILKR